MNTNETGAKNTMDTKTTNSYECLSGSVLKVIAAVTMFIDHFGASILIYEPWAFEPYFYFLGTPIGPYRLCRDIGRIAFPIFCFLLTEGFLHTSNRFRYARNLFIFALISEIPFSMMLGDLGNFQYQNTLFTLLLGYLAIWGMEHFRDRVILQILCALSSMWVAYFLHTDYDWRGILLILILYLFHDRRNTQVILAGISLLWEWKACFSMIYIRLYNGKRGFLKGKFGKYFFYCYYPLHMVLLIILRYFILGFAH